MPDASLDPTPGGARSRLGLTLERDAAPHDVEMVKAGLRAFNVAHIGEPKEERIHLFVRDADGSVAGGLLGEIRWRWLHVEVLWVSTPHRGQGYGAALLDRAEGHARSRDCLGIHLDTFDYQARPFYEKHGYQLFGTLEGYPPGHRQYHLAKRFGPEKAASPSRKNQRSG